MLEIALLISNRQELLDFLNSIAEESFTENTTRFDTKWKIIDIIAYELGNNKAKVIQRSRELYNETTKVNVFKNHFSLIVNFEKYCHVYQCMHCDKLWYRNCDNYRHTKTCLTTVRESFRGGAYHNPYTIFEKLEQIGIQVPKQDLIYPY